MAEIAISNLPNELTAPVDADLLAIDDISAGETKKIQAVNLLGGATQAEMGHVHGVTSDIQTQIDTKAPIAAPTFTGTVTLPGDPASSLHAATKQYVDAIASGLDIKASCRVATAAALPANTAAGSGVGKTLTINAVGILTVDGVNTVLNDRILVKDESTGANNGIYKVTTEGTAGVAAVLTRATDFDQDAEVTAGAFTFTEEGTAGADSGFVLSTNDPITVDTTALSFSQFSGAGQITAGSGLTKSGNTLNVGAGAGISVAADAVKVTVSATDRLLGRSSAGAGDVEEVACTAAGRALLDDADAAAQRTTIGLGNVENLKVKLDGTAAPAAATDDVTLGYSVGSRWFDITNDKEYVCLDNTDGAAVWIETTASGGGSSASYVKVSDVKSSGTSAGTFTQDAWQTRTLNTEDSDADNICSLSSNQITLSAGTYECRIIAPAYRVEYHKIKLRNVTDSVDILIGTSEYTVPAGGISGHSFVVGKFTIAASKAIEVQHRCSSTFATHGFGVLASLGVSEVYTVAEFWKVA